MNRVVVLGRGGAGKSTGAARLGQLTGLPVLELDKYFWPADLTPLPPEVWSERQRELAAADRWIMDGDLGPYDVLAPRLRRADTVLIFDFSMLRCAWRALRRSRERIDFWCWLVTWRRRSRPAVLQAVRQYAPDAAVHTLRNPAQWQQFLERFDSAGPASGS